MPVKKQAKRLRVIPAAEGKPKAEAIWSDIDLPIRKMMQDIRHASGLMTRRQAMYLVSLYYSMQELRMRFSSQLRRLEEAQEPSEVFEFMGAQQLRLEKQVAVSLDLYSENHRVGQWMRSITGVGPVIAAGFLAHVDISRVNYAGQIWKFAGLSPDIVWKKGQKRPFNADLRVLCWKLGESFVKVSNNEKSLYGNLYSRRKDLENYRNEKGLYKDIAADLLASRRIRSGSPMEAAYKAGKLPPAHIHARARRFAVKIWIGHLFEVWFEYHNEREAPLPYAIAMLKHEDYLAPPNYNKTRPFKERIDVEVTDEEPLPPEDLPTSIRYIPSDPQFEDWFQENDFYERASIVESQRGEEI